jgi:hypothetical protein
MPFSAIICAVRPQSDSPESLAVHVHFAGQSLLEYQARQAAEAGAGKILIVVSSVAPALSRAVDRLIDDGLDIMLVRDIGTLLRQAPRDSDFLIIGDGMVVPQRFMNTLGGRSGNGLLVVEASGPTESFERIDGMHRWAGLARMAPAVLFSTLDLVGDWDLQLTLVRAIVQAGAERVVAPQDDVLEGRLAQIDGQQSADLVTEALLAQPVTSTIRGSVGAERYILGPPASMLAVAFMRSQIPPSQVALGALIVAALGALACAVHWPVLAMIVLLCAVTLHEAADHLSNRARRPGLKGWMAAVPDAAVLAGIWLLGAEQGNGRDGLYLALLLGIIVVRHGRGVQAGPAWAAATPGSALFILLIGTMSGYFGFGLMLALLAAIAWTGVLLLSAKSPESSRSA